MKALRLALATLLLTPLIARGQDLCLPTVMVSYPVFYYPVCELPAPYYVPPCIPGPVVIPACPSIQAPSAGTPAPPPAKEGATGSPGFAPPTAAPPSERPKSQTSLSPRSTSLSPAYDVFPVATGQSAKSTRTSFDVTFWNLTDHDLALRVDGQARTLAASKNTTISLGREFVWQIDEQDPKRERLAKEDNGLEIVIRH